MLKVRRLISQYETQEGFTRSVLLMHIGLRKGHERV